jgi:hypothetical protein
MIVYEYIIDSISKPLLENANQLNKYIYIPAFIALNYTRTLLMNLEVENSYHFCDLYLRLKNPTEGSP